MLRTDFSFDLPEELIAQRPCAKRGEDRLMLLGRQNGAVTHLMMNDLPRLVEPGTLMVFNDSRVRRARVAAIKENTGKEHEFMFIRQIDTDEKVWRVLTGNARKQKKGMRYSFPNVVTVNGDRSRSGAGSQTESRLEITTSGGADGGKTSAQARIIGTIIDNPALLGTEERDILFNSPITEEYFEANGHIPLPPYIKRGDDASDADRYQNVYAKQTGSAACPTAGLHFTDDMLRRLKDRGAQIEYITLHVGLGTFLPVRERNIEEHKMHQETFTITQEAADAVNKAHREGRPILAVGTTSVRTLESSADDNGTVQSGTHSTRIFIYPGYKFKVINQMFTNFHTPESTLLMLVSAFAGKEHILAAYSEAVKKQYRFFSYGDAMLIK